MLPQRLVWRSALFAVLSVPMAFMGSSAGCGDDTTDGDGPKPPQLKPGDLCNPAQPNIVRLRVQPERVFVATCADGGDACAKRPVKVIVEPDVCVQTPLSFESSDPSKLPAPEAGSVTLYQGEYLFDLAGASAPGTYTLTVNMPRGDGENASTTFEVVVLDETLPTCSGDASEAGLAAGNTLRGSGGLAGASIGVQEGGNDAAEGSFLWPIQPFDASLSCGDMDLPEGYLALGPAITFGPGGLALPRELPLSVPANPARIPDRGRMRHVEVLYSGPSFKAPRVVPIGDPQFVNADGAWALAFKAPRMGTYQAVVKQDAGTKKRTRRLTHRAAIGISMGGVGSSMFGFRHHDMFDVVAPLGGPGSWSWLIHHIEKNHLGGFRPIAPGTLLADIPLERTECDATPDCQADETCLGKTAEHPGKCTLLGATSDPYEHPQAFNNWWAEYPRTGTGGKFPRAEYAQIFRDLALQFGNPNGENLSEGAENLPAGVRPDDPSQRGDRTNDECTIWVDPIGGHPNEDKQSELANSCPAERCANTLTLLGYYDDEFNPDGTFPVITVCDGTPENEDESPWANAWKPEGPNNYPLEVGLAVDYNANGVRDELEPIIKSGYEPWDDSGEDGEFSVDEPGYEAGVNDDPAGDDYNAQYNPGGTEGDHRVQIGEAFRDLGLDGVASTDQQPAGGWQQAGDGYDVGEGDGEFTAASGLKRMWDHDPAAIIRGQVEVPGGPLDDDALSRVDVWTDGGLRDIFNFHVAAQHMSGAMVARGRPTQYFSDFTQLPGFQNKTAAEYTPALMPWEDLPGSVFMRYGMVDPDANAIENGNGQHVGTGSQILFRLQTALYYIGNRWPHTDLRTLVKSSNDNPAPGAEVCEIDGGCTFEFTSSEGRRGPVAITLPPGYAHVEQQDQRYPVIYVLHGYGQTPEDLSAVIILVSNWMNNPGDGAASRMPKAILVYVDGRCRVDDEDRAECIRGSFFTDSPRQQGFHSESWWLELMEHIDGKYRTLPPADVEWED